MSLIVEIPPGSSSQVYLRFPYASAVCYGKYVCRICTVIFLFPSKKSLSRSNGRLRPNYRVYCVHNYLLQRSVIPSHTFTGEVLVSLKHRAYLIKRHPYCSTERVFIFYFLLRMSACRSSISLFFPLEGPGAHPRGGSTAVVAAVLVLGIPYWGFVEIVRFAHAKELASLTRFFEEERTEGVTLSSRSPTVLTGGPEPRFSPIVGLAGSRTSSYPRLGSRCKASKRKSGTRRSNHCWLSPCGRMPCFIRRAVKRGQSKMRC